MKRVTHEDWAGKREKFETTDSPGGGSRDRHGNLLRFVEAIWCTGPDTTTRRSHAAL